MLTCASFTPRERSLSGWIYIRGYATIRGGRKYFIRGVERKKDPGLDEFLPSWDRARTILITLFFPINNLAYIIIIIILQVWGIGKLEL